MEKMCQVSMQMIKVFNIKSKKQYRALQKYYLMLSPDSLKYISQTRDFKKIIKMAKESN